MSNKYFNNAILGNSRVLACMSDKAELIRLYYPYIDYFQLIDTYSFGTFENNQIHWFKDADLINQYYEGNILYTELKVNGVEVILRDYVLPDENILVRAIKLMKPSNLILYSKLNSNVDKQVSSMVVDNTLIQYCQDMYMATFSDKDIYKYRINNAKDSLETPNFNSEDYIGMSADAIISYENVSEIVLYTTLNSKLNSTSDGCLETVKWCKKQKENLLYNMTKKFWDNYMESFSRNEILKNVTKVKERGIIERTIYMFALLSNEYTGAILASPDVDENYTKCGRYGYCWPRDALFINESLRKLNMYDQLDKFYSRFATKTQLDNGLFEQRYYSNGELAPSWGLQIDETASILIGLSTSYMSDFVPELILKATTALANFIDERGLSKPCYDLWEERKGVHLYSTASIYEALKKGKEMLKNFKTNEYSNLINKIDVLLPKIKEAIKTYFVEDGHLKRSLDNNQVDISLLSVVTTFDIFDIDDDVVQNTVTEIERTLHMPNGGYMRYQWDNYMGGNTWIISSLWMALYQIKAGNIEKAKELFDWVTNHADNLYFLPEQIEREGHKTAWVTQLSWSHAMYILVKDKLLESEGK